MIAAVPGQEWLPGGVIETPALAGFHARLMDASAEHVVIAAYDDAIEGIAHLAFIALDVELDTAGIMLLKGRAPAVEAIVDDGKESPPERVEESDRRRMCMSRRFFCRSLLVRPQRAAYAACMPGRQKIGRW